MYDRGFPVDVLGIIASKTDSCSATAHLLNTHCLLVLLFRFLKYSGYFSTSLRISSFILRRYRHDFDRNKATPRFLRSDVARMQRRSMHMNAYVPRYQHVSLDGEKSISQGDRITMDPTTMTHGVEVIDFVTTSRLVQCQVIRHMRVAGDGFFRFECTNLGSY